MQRTVLIGLAVTGLGAASLWSAPARAAVVRYDFAGPLLFPSDNNNPLGSIVTPNGQALGFFQFDAATLPTSPGHWTLPTAVFQGDFGGLNVAAVGATATVSGALDSTLGFTFALDPSTFPIPVASAAAEFDFITYTDNYFSLSSLPATTTVPPGDKLAAVRYVTTGGISGQASTDTDASITTVTVTPTTPVPEPASLGLLGVGVAGLGLARRRRPPV